MPLFFWLNDIKINLAENGENWQYFPCEATKRLLLNNSRLPLQGTYLVFKLSLSSYWILKSTQIYF